MRCTPADAAHLPSPARCEDAAPLKFTVIFLIHVFTAKIEKPLTTAPAPHLSTHPARYGSGVAPVETTAVAPNHVWAHFSMSWWPGNRAVLLRGTLPFKKTHGKSHILAIIYPYMGKPVGY